MMSDRLAQKVAQAKALSEVYALFSRIRLSDASSRFQLAIDVNYTTLANFSEMDFVVAGPGARDGIRKCFRDVGDYSDDDVIRVMADAAEGGEGAARAVFG
jgi:alpha-glutamyl/putrescinyl thymine pyrophosphorylase clade 1